MSLCAPLRSLGLLVLAVSVPAAFGQTPPAPNAAADARARQVISDPRFRAMVGIYERDHERFVAELIKLTEIPAPPFGEEPRAQAYLAMLREAGLENCERDAEGNVMGLWRGRSGGSVPLLAVAAHLDTVFPEGTDVRVKRSGTRLVAPGIGDDTRGLAFLLALIRAMREAKVETAGDILFIGNVGEEGPGDLRGVRYLFTKGPWKDRIKRFISVDGTNLDLVTNSGLGSLRYKVTFKGPGGHSWGAFGNVSPAFAMGDAIARLGQLKVPASPKVSYNVGVVSGGTSVNSIPFETAMEIDMRAVDPAALKDIDAKFKQIVAAAVDAENAARSTANGKITADIKLIGDRPSGTTSPATPELRQIAATMRAYDKVPVWSTNSTDANLPISLGIPAFAIARNAGHKGGRGHSLDEWVDVEKGQAVKDFELAAAMILSVADLP
ncbi:MAG: M20/M25/M40 family metallo-hydrolase [Opitutaceae bacterium]|nr:M20/M25/M40 family metallo-hydrolase [Opitutaceae bacterium]